MNSKGIFLPTHKTSEAMGSSMVDVNPTLGQRRGSSDTRQKTPQVNGEDQMLQSGNYTHSSLRVVSIDEIKVQPRKDYHESNSSHVSKPHHPSHGKTRGAFCWGWSSGSTDQKISYRTQNRTQTKIIYMQCTVHIVIQRQNFKLNRPATGADSVCSRI